MTHDNARSKSQGTHRCGHVARVLGQAVWSFGFVGIAAPSQIEAKERASASQAFGNANEIHVGSGQAMQRNYRRTAAGPVTEGEFDAVP
jgi:hypothetical protein